MSKEKNFNVNNDFVSYKSSKIVFCQDGRILLTDKDDEIVVLRDCENCKQKDQRIAELEKQLAEKDKLLENAIVPKFKLWQEIWYIAKKFCNTTFLGYEILKGNIFSYVSNQSTLIIEYKDKKVPIVDNEFIFAAEQEAEEALEKLEEV
jgi:hypothetical protein